MNRYKAQDAPILIIGAGIGGLATALALHRQGFKVEVFERSKELRWEGGTGLQIWSNAMQALQVLGITEPLQKDGVIINLAQVWSSHGKMLIETPIGRLSQEIGIPSIIIRRSLLMQVLFETCKDIPIHFDANCTGYVESEDAITLHLEDGREIQGSVLIGADGLRSVVRTHLLRHSEPQYLGYSIWRAISEDTRGVTPGVIHMVWGKHGMSVGTWHVDASSIAWTMGINVPPEGQDAPGTTKAYLIDHLKNVRGPIRGVIQNTPDDQIFRSDAYALKRVETLGYGRAILLGDAAHAMPTAVGQGACQAIEDSVVLAQSLVDVSNLIDGLRLYERRRRERVSWLHKQAYQLGKMQNWDNELLCSIRDTFASLMPESSSLKMWRKIITFPDAELKKTTQLQHT